MKIRSYLAALALLFAFASPPLLATVDDNAPRVAYTASGGQTAFTYTFEILAATDLKVYQNGTLLTYTTHYTVSGVGVQAGGTVTLVTGATASDEIVIYRDQAISRTTDYQPGAKLNPDTLDLDFDRLVLGVQQVERDVARALRLAPADVYAPLTDFVLPDSQARASKYLAFDSDGKPVATAGTAASLAASLVPVDDAGGYFSSTNVETVLQEIRADLAAVTASNGASTIGVQDSAGYFLTATVEAALAELGAAPRTFGTIALLKAATARFDGEVVTVVCYYTCTTPDGGGGVFKWVAASSDTANGGTVLAADAGGTGRWLALGEMNAKRWGAKGDATTDDTVRLQAAIDAGGEIIFPAGTYLADGLTVSGTGVSLVGQTPNLTRFRFTNTTGTLFTITGSLFRLSGFDFDSPSATHSAGAVFDLQAGSGQVRNIRINGSFFDIFKMENNAADGWHFDLLRVAGGWTNNSLFRLKATTSTVASTHVVNLHSATNATWTEAAVILDTGVDTFQITGGELGGLGKLVHIKDTAPGQDPRYIHFDGVSVETSTDDAVTIDAGDDIRFSDGYFATALNAFVISGGRDIAIENNHFVSIKRAALDLNGGTRVHFNNNKVLDCSQDADVTYSSIDIAAGVSEWEVKGNTFRLRSGTTNKPLRQLTIASGASTKFRYGGNDWGVAGTDYGAAGAAAVSDASSGQNVVIEDSVQTALFRGASPVSHTGTTSETDLATITVPAGALGNKGGMQLRVGGTSTGTAGIKTIKLYFGSLQLGAVAIPAADTDSWVIVSDVFNVTQTAQAFFSHTSRTPNDTEGTVVRNKSAAGAVDTTAAVTVKVTGQLANSADSIVLRLFANEVIRR